ncbi:hypothetical protein PENSPDRAFT_616177 [Peniophora sp. CONT]|nr:hypothetical protein PENSPDRAFT_616177 [Peniophora sp. CONT]
MAQSTPLHVLAVAALRYYRLHQKLIGFERIMDLYNAYITSDARHPGQLDEGFSLSNVLSAMDLHSSILAQNDPHLQSDATNHPSSDFLSSVQVAMMLLDRFEATEGEAEPLDRSIHAGYQALSHARNDEEHLACFDVLIAAFWTSYMLRGNSELPRNLSTLIDLCRRACKLENILPTQKCLMIENLALVLHTSSDDPDPSDPEQSPLGGAVELYREALRLHEGNDLHRAELLFSLVIVQYKASAVEDDEVDLDELLELMHRARDLGLSNGLFLDSYAMLLEERYSQCHRPEDLTQAIAIRRQIRAVYPAGHPGHFGALSSLASDIWRRYRLEDHHQDLEECLELRRHCLQVCHPYDIPNAVEAMANLVNVKTYILQHLNPEVWEAAVDALRHEQFEASESLDDDPALVCAILADLGQKSLREEPALAYHCFARASSSSGYNFDFRYRAAFQKAEAALALGSLPEAIDAFRASLELLAQLLETQATIELRQWTLALPIARQLTYRPFSVALEARDLEAAVEFLEHGRGLLWTKMRGYRESVIGLETMHPEVAQDLQDVQRRLESLMADSASSRALQKSPPLGPGYLSTRVMDVFKASLAEEHAALAHRYDRVVQTIQALPEFERAFRPKTFHWFREAAAEGPVIILNVSQDVSDFVIVDRFRPPIAFALSPKLTGALPKLGEHLKIANRGARAVSQYHSADHIHTVLRTLWKFICQPVAAVLEGLGFKRGSRIWLCPTGKLSSFPLHAAGPYSTTDEATEQVFGDMFTISYTYTLSALIENRRERAKAPDPPSGQPTGLEMLAIGQSSQLSMVKDELRVIDEVFRDQAMILDNEQAKPATVVQNLLHTKIVHFSTHGALRITAPFASHFVLHNHERLDLLQIMKARPQRAELAFLAACHAAAGTHRSPDEALSLASALLFCGFRSAIGTLWTMADQDGPTLARLFYSRLASHRDAERGVDCSRSAEALSEAVREMRRQGVPLERWSTFVHVGA